MSLHARKMLDGQDHANSALFQESSSIRDAFHEHKFKAVGAYLPLAAFQLPTASFCGFVTTDDSCRVCRVLTCQVTGLLWAGSIAFSLRGGKMAMPLYQRMIDARIFAQWMTVGSAMALMILTTVFPDDRNVRQYHLEHAPTSIHKHASASSAASPSSPTAKLIAEAVAASAELQDDVVAPAIVSARTVSPKTL